MAWAPQIFGSAKSSEFSANAHSRLVSIVLDGVLGPPRLVLQTWWCPCISAVPVATHEASQGSKMQTRELVGGSTEKSVSQWGVHDFLPVRPSNTWLLATPVQILYTKELKAQSHYILRSIGAAWSWRKSGMGCCIFGKEAECSFVQLSLWARYLLQSLLYTISLFQLSLCFKI